MHDDGFRSMCLQKAVCLCVRWAISHETSIGVHLLMNTEIDYSLLCWGKVWVLSLLKKTESPAWDTAVLMAGQDSMKGADDHPNPHNCMTHLESP